MITTKKHISPDIKTILAQKALDTNPEYWQQKLKQITSQQVENALTAPAGIYSFNKLLALVSPAAESYLEQMAQIAYKLTIRRFGRTIRLYAPLYLSNYCTNSCRYCGFSTKIVANRKRLTIEQALQEADILTREGFEDVLLVSGDDRQFITTDYLARLAKKLRGKFCCISIEIYQLTTQQYTTLFQAGVEGVTIYQETYNRSAYEHYHPKGPKADYDKRLSAPDSIATAQMREIGLGVLLGLTDWRTEALALAEHAHYIMKHYWQSHVSFSFPRLRPAHQVERSQFKYLPSDKNLVQMLLALRLCFADAGMVLSTREYAQFRDKLIKLGITKISAGSKTSPGGYSKQCNSIEQFQVDDSRTASQIYEMIKNQGFEPVWKDWDKAFIEG
ncbi:MAG: 2-iminoacetate synthase ThiH [Planctomycetota bacterium]|jgi:2-iminoacetate synthase